MISFHISCQVDSFVTIAEQRASETEDLGALSFLAVAQDVEVEEPEKEPEPESLLNVLAEGVKEMKQQGEASSKHLKSLFKNSFLGDLFQRWTLFLMLFSWECWVLSPFWLDYLVLHPDLYDVIWHPITCSLAQVCKMESRDIRPSCRSKACWKKPWKACRPMKRNLSKRRRISRIPSPS